MAKYQYMAADRTGKRVSGLFEGANREAAVAYLRSQNLIPLSIDAQKEEAKAATSTDLSGSLRKRKKLKPKDIIDFTKQLTTLLRAGVPILPALETIASQSDNHYLYVTLQTIQRDLQGGSDLSTAMSKHPKIFSELYVNSVRAGETGGVLDTVFTRLSEVLARDAEIQKKVKSALRYPIIVSCGMAIAFAILLIFVVPKFVKLFSEMKLDLPVPTKIIIFVSNTLQHWWWLIFGVLFFGVYFGRQALQRPEIKRVVDGYLLKVPVVGDLLMKSAMSRFTRMFATLNKAGLPIIQSLQVVARTITNTVIREDLLRVASSIERGRGIATSMRDSTVFPVMVVKMIQIGEESGAIDEMLLHVSEYYDDEVSNSVEALTDMIEPLLTVLMGGMVAVLALAIFLPMWNLTDLAGKQ